MLFNPPPRNENVLPYEGNIGIIVLSFGVFLEQIIV